MGFWFNYIYLICYFTERWKDFSHNFKQKQICKKYAILFQSRLDSFNVMMRSGGEVSCSSWYVCSYFCDGSNGYKIVHKIFQNIINTLFFLRFFSFARRSVFFCLIFGILNWSQPRELVKLPLLFNIDVCGQHYEVIFFFLIYIISE